MPTINTIERPGSRPEGAKTFSFDEAKQAISSYAEGLRDNVEDTGDQQDLEGAQVIEKMIDDLNKPGQEGTKALDAALGYIEGVLRTKQNLDGSMRPEMQAQMEEQQAVREALLAEKQIRAEQQGRREQGNKRLETARGDAARLLENLYENAGVPENTPSRQEFLNRVQRMSGEELHFVNDELRRAAGKFGTTGDGRSLDAALSNLVSKDFTKTGVAKRNTVNDQSRLEQLRSSLNPEALKQPNIPTDSRGVFRYFKDNFGGLEQVPLEEFRRAFTPEIEERYRFWVQAKISSIAREKPSGGRYADTVGNVLGNNGAFIQRLVSSKEGRVVNLEELLHMPFSTVAQKYLNMDLANNPEFLKSFNVRKWQI